jgi:hypothetical protein
MVLVVPLLAQSPSSWVVVASVVRRPLSSKV